MSVVFLKSLKLSLAVMAFGLIIFAPSFAKAQFDPLEAVCADAGGQGVACAENELGKGAENPVTSTTQNVVNLLSLATAAIAVVVIIIAGITMTLSQGDAGKVKSSRDAIIYAAVGLVVAALSRAIVFFIVNRTR